MDVNVLEITNRRQTETVQFPLHFYSGHSLSYGAAPLSAVKEYAFKHFDVGSQQNSFCDVSAGT